MNTTIPFSEQLKKWLESKQVKTVGSMLDVFDEKSFAFMFFIFLLFPALPIPTGGISHVFEIIVMLLALQLIIGREELWLPERLKKRQVPLSMTNKLLPSIHKQLVWLERFSRVRGRRTIKNKWFRSQLGIVVFILTLIAFIAPPFTFLDTLPCLGVVLIALGIILEDIYIITTGYAVGFVGAALVFLLGAGIVNIFATLI